MKPRGRYKPRKAPSKPTTLGQRLRALRLQHGLTQAQVAGRLFSDQTTVSAWERGKAEPSGAALAALCSLFEVSRTALETGRGLDKAYPSAQTNSKAAEGFRPAFDPLELDGKVGALVDIATGRVRPATLAELKKALDVAAKAKLPVWVVKA
ncbi:MAG: helix-turn-helix transcriptional regulator [Bacteroidetes bacterium]|nr:helix-turn-helix transcriptional regulator [Bacteroidota bacterium]